MANNLDDYYYNRLVSSSNSDLKTLNKYKSVNNLLKKNDWLFISPIFFQGYELTTFSKLINTEINPKKKILEVISKKFYNLSHTASFIEGYCSRCDHIKPFLMSIEHSLILTFQKDYEGAIKTIIPIIEGIIRKYLVEEKGYDMDRIQFEQIRKSFNHLEADLNSNYNEILRNYKTVNNIPIKFTDEQIKHLLELETAYNEIWFSFVSDFINKSFYLKTNNIKLTNEINRHSILHELGNDFEYNFENYIKIFLLLQFMTWVFLRKENKSVLDEIEGYRFFEKVMAYEQIIKLSEKLIYEKHILYKNYGCYNDNLLKENFPNFNNEIVPKKQIIIHKLLKKISRYFWNKNIKINK